MGKNIVIIGAGVVGSAVAFELSRRGASDIHVYDTDLEGSLSSSERNAGGVRHLWQQPINSELSRISIQYFEKIADEIGFHQKGYLWMFSPEKRKHAEETFQHAKSRGLAYELLGVSDIQKRYPFIDKTENLACAVFGQKDGILNTNGLKEHYRKMAREKGVTFHDRVWVTRVAPQNGKVSFSSTAIEENAIEQQLSHPGKPCGVARPEESCEKVILAAGAWSEELLLPYFPERLTQPIRRQISFFSAENFDMSPYGMVVDTSGVYFHAEGGHLLGGLVLKDEPSGYRFHYDHDFFENYIWPALYERSSAFERLKPISGWGGLYSYTKDITGILGEVPSLPHVYEAHSFTGHGVMHSYGAAVLLAEKILDGKFISADGGKLSRERFSKNALLPEALHI